MLIQIYFWRFLMKKQMTKKQAKRDNLIVFIIVLAIGIALLALGLTISELKLIGLFFGGIFILCAPIAWCSRNKSIKHSYCPHCDAKYDYNRDISWDETDRIETDTKVTSVVEFTCVCPNCGEEYIFSEKFLTASYDKNKGAWKEHNLRTIAKKHFVK